MTLIPGAALVALGALRILGYCGSATVVNSTERSKSFTLSSQEVVDMGIGLVAMVLLVLNTTMGWSNNLRSEGNRVPLRNALAKVVAVVTEDTNTVMDIGNKEGRRRAIYLRGMKKNLTTVQPTTVPVSATVEQLEVVSANTPITEALRVRITARVRSRLASQARPVPV